MQATIDRVQVQQVLVNLLRNAFEAVADQPAECRTVTISAEADSQQLEIAVHDQGEGVAREDHDRVFEAFFTTKPGGVGIGLAISRSIIEDHGGRIWVDSQDKAGATFRFSLPLEAEHAVKISNGVCR
jgi:two-component system sensor kinase FixL